MGISRALRAIVSRVSRRGPSLPVNNKPPSHITPCSSVDPQTAARHYGPTSSSGGHQYSQDPGQQYDIRAQQGLPSEHYGTPAPWFTGLDRPRRISQRSGRLQQGFGVPDESSESEAPNQQATAAELLQAMIEQGLARSSASPGVESVREDAMTGADPTAGMDTMMDAYSGVHGLPYDRGRQEAPDIPDYDAGRMTQESWEQAWQQAKAMHDASRQGQDPVAAAGAAYEQLVSAGSGQNNASAEENIQVVLQMIANVASEQAAALYGDAATPQQREQVLEDIVQKLFPANQDAMDNGMAAPDRQVMQQQPDDPMQFMDPFGPMGPMM